MVVSFLPTNFFLNCGMIRTEEAKAIIRKGAKMNGVDLSEEKLDELTRPDPVTHHDGEEKDLANDSQEISVWSLLKVKLYCATHTRGIFPKIYGMSIRKYYRMFQTIDFLKEEDKDYVGKRN